MAFGLMAGVYESARSGTGQVVDCAMVDGVTSLLTVFHAFRQLRQLTPRRGANVLDGEAPFYRCYETSDGGPVAIGCIEKRFYDAMLGVLDIGPGELPARSR